MESLGQSDDIKNLIKKKILVPRIVWAALLILFGVYWFSVSRMIHLPNLHEFSQDEVGIFQKTFNGVGLFLLMLSWFVPPYLLRRAERNNTSLYVAAFSGFLLRESFLFSVGIFGFFQSILTKDINQGLPSILVCLIGLVLNFPMVRKFRLEGSELVRLQEANAKSKIAPTPIWVKIAGYGLIVLGIIDAAMGGYAHALHAQNQIDAQSPLLSFGHFQSLFWGAGILFLLWPRFQESKKTFWLILTGIILLAIVSMSDLSKKSTDKASACASECERMFKAGQLKPGVDIEACIQASCGN